MRQKAASCGQQTGKLTIVVQDNSPIHKSQEVRACWKCGSQQGNYHLESFIFNSA